MKPDLERIAQRLPTLRRFRWSPAMLVHCWIPARPGHAAARGTIRLGRACSPGLFLDSYAKDGDCWPDLDDHLTLLAIMALAREAGGHELDLETYEEIIAALDLTMEQSAAQQAAWAAAKEADNG